MFRSLELESQRPFTLSLFFFGPFIVFTYWVALGDYFLVFLCYDRMVWWIIKVVSKDLIKRYQNEVSLRNRSSHPTLTFLVFFASSSKIPSFSPPCFVY